MTSDLAAFVKYLGHSHIAIKSVKTGEKGSQEGHFKAIEINKAEDFITLRNGKRQLWVNLQTLKPEVGRYITFADIESYKNVYIDLDCEKPEGMKDYAATEAERSKALSQFPIFRRWLEARGFRPGLELRTGNGAGMVLPIPETKAEPVFIAKLATFLKVVQADIPCVDPAMFDPPRVIGIPGTINAKLETDDRENKIRKMVGDASTRIEDVVLLNYINSLEPDPSALKEWNKKYSEPQAPPEADKGDLDTDDILDRLTGLFEYEPELKALLDGHIERFKGDRSAAEYGACGRLIKFGFTDPEINFIMCKVSKIGKWQEEGPHYRFDQTLRKLREAEEAPKADEQKPKGPTVSEVTREQNGLEHLTEGGNASRLERIHGDDMRFNHTHKKWYVWDGGRWKVDDNGNASRLAEDVVGMLYNAAAKATDSKMRDKIAVFAKSTDSRKGIANMLALAANRRRFAVTADDFDRDPWLLGAGEVTIDLKTCEAREPRREDFITMRAGAVYDSFADCPQWKAFVKEIFASNEELINYIKRAFGYCLTGSMDEQVFFFCFGLGANGKSVLLAILRALMGEYAKQADFSSFLIQRNEKVRNDLAALAGARVITAVEAEEGGRLSMQVLKSWTGGDPITARFLFGENFTFKPQGKIWLAANTKPAITERNYAAWRRVHLIPFTVTIPPEKRDLQLESKLIAELPGIFNWALEGLRDYLKVGLEAPEAVTKATDEYRQENDSLESFIAECCDLGKLKVCKNTELYPNYVSFCRMSGLTALSQTKFSPEMNSKPGISSKKSKFGVEWRGIDLKGEWKPPITPSNPSPQSGDSKGDGLVPNPETKLVFPLREGLCAFESNPSPNEAADNGDGLDQPVTMDKTDTSKPSDVDGKEEESRGNSVNVVRESKPETSRFPGMKKRVCCLCGHRSSHDLTPYSNPAKGINGYICVNCHMHGPPAPPEEPNPQTTLEGEA